MAQLLSEMSRMKADFNHKVHAGQAAAQTLSAENTKLKQKLQELGVVESMDEDDLWTDRLPILESLVEEISSFRKSIESIGLHRLSQLSKGDNKL